MNNEDEKSFFAEMDNIIVITDSVAWYNSFSEEEKQQARIDAQKEEYECFDSIKAQILALKKLDGRELYLEDMINLYTTL